MRSSSTNSYKIRMFLTKKSIFQPYLLACFRWNREPFNLCFVSVFVSGKNPAKQILGKAEMNRKRGQLVNTADKLARLHSWRVSQKFCSKNVNFVECCWILRPFQAVINKFIVFLCDSVVKELTCLEMDDVTRLFGLSFCMLVGCYVAGAIPLAFAMSEVSFTVREILTCSYIR